MRNVYSAQQIRDAEQPLLAAGEPLMERASRALYQHVSRVVRSLDGEPTQCRDVVFLIGAGNNGGDALFAAALLAIDGPPVTVVLASENVHEEGLAAVRRTSARIIEVCGKENLSDPHISDELVASIRSSAVVVDGLLGIGARGAPRGAVGALLHAIALNEPYRGVAGRPIVVAVDVPSGVDATTGSICDSSAVIAADMTVTFGGVKSGLMLGPGAHFAGEVEVVDIGLDLPSAPLSCLQPGDFAEGESLHYLVGRPHYAAHKYTRGVVGIHAGSRQFPGAGLLSVSAAQRSGIGMVRYLGPAEVADRVLTVMPEVVTVSGRVQAWLVGSGMPADDATRAVVDSVLIRPEPAVLDAGALAVLRRQDLGALDSRHVLTPHAGELADLLNEFLGPRKISFTREIVEGDPLAAAQTLHQATHATVVAKGPVTVVVSDDGTYAQPGTTSRLATAGSGDVLAGIMVAALARAVSESEYRQAGSRQDFPPRRSGNPADCLPEPAWGKIAAAAVFLHGLAGNNAACEAERKIENCVVHSSQPIVALDIASSVPRVHAKLASTRLTHTASEQPPNISSLERNATT